MFITTEKKTGKIIVMVERNGARIPVNGVELALVNCLPRNLTWEMKN